MSHPPLLLEIGCEEIPARMIAGATEELGRRVIGLLDAARLPHGEVSGWGGPRRLAVRIEAVPPRQAERDELVLGPPEGASRDADNSPSPAIRGFAKKHGVAPEALSVVETERGRYLGLRRRVAGLTLGELLAASLPAAVESMPFPKTMRWSDGRRRWVRPVHWLLALHGSTVLPVKLFDVQAGANSRGHRFHGALHVPVAHPDDYAEALAAARVIVDSAERRQRLSAALAQAARTLEGELVDDPSLLGEVADLVEWPGVVLGHFDRAFLDLPREILVTTLRHHQKCFSVQDRQGRLLPVFLAVSNSPVDPAGHITRGNEWVVGGRLEDAAFFWREDRREPLASRSERLRGVIFHGSGTYADKVRRLEVLVQALGERLGASGGEIDQARQASREAKNDLVTGTVGEFPELQGRVGGLMLRGEGAPEPVAQAVYAHYQPAGPGDAVPAGGVACLLALADRLDTLHELLRAGEVPTGSRDPLGLRRAANGLFRIIIERGWSLALADLVEVTAANEALVSFLRERLPHYLRDAGHTPKEVAAVLGVDANRHDGLSLPDVVARLQALRGVAAREDFAHLADLTKRVDTILARNADVVAALPVSAAAYTEEQPAARELHAWCERWDEEALALEATGRYGEVVDLLARFVQPVDRFFGEVLVIDAAQPEATRFRWAILTKLRSVLTRCFDLRQLAGQADRRVAP